MTPAPAPNGYWADAHGRLTPESLIKPIDRTRDQLVRDLIAKARLVENLLAEFKALAFSEIATFVELSAEQHKVKLGGKKGNVTLTTFDGRFKIIRAVQESIAFDEQLQVAKTLIDNCVQRWLEGSRSEVRAIIDDAFQVDREGKISTGRVLGLKRLDIQDEEWLRAMNAIADSIRRNGSSTYVRFYERKGDGDQYQPISLDLANV